MTEIEVPDPGVPDDPEGAAAQEGGEPESPYRNLFVPLVVVPAMIVIVLVLVFVLFGAIAGTEATPRENLATMLRGGANERTQAAFNLARQVSEDIRADVDDDPETVPEWGIGPEFLVEVRAAWDTTDEDDYEVRFVLAMVLAWLDEEDGLGHVRTMLQDIPAEDDEDGQIRFFLIQLLGQLGDSRAAPDVIAFLSHEDTAFRQMAASALQAFDDEASLDALAVALSDPALALRGQAAISLAVRGAFEGEAVLHELLDSAAYERDRAIDPQRWRDARNVRYTRQRALVALARLHRPQDKARIQEVADGDADSEVRATALELISKWDELPLGGTE